MYIYIIYSTMKISMVTWGGCKRCLTKKPEIKQIPNSSPNRCLPSPLVFQDHNLHIMDLVLMVFHISHHFLLSPQLGLQDHSFAL